MDDKRGMISGNTVLAPQYLPKEKDKYEELKKLRNENKKKQKLKQIKSKKKVLRNIAITFILGVTLIGRYSMLYNVQRDLNRINTQISTVKVENENLKVELLKFSNIHYIEEKAISQLHMIRPDKDQVIYTDLSKNNFGKLTKEKVENKQQNLMEKFKNMIF